jgi:hypothetical protein
VTTKTWSTNGCKAPDTEVNEEGLVAFATGPSLLRGCS